jgi:DNA-binding beta-propeller fold protein YncE
MRSAAAGLLVLLFGFPIRAAGAQSLVEPRPSWPPPPQSPRITTLGAFSGPRDLGLEKGGLLRFFRNLFFGSEVRELTRPYGIAVSREGELIVVADPGARALHGYDLRSGRYTLVRSAGGRDLGTPVGAALDDRGNVYVTDSERAEVLAFDPALRFRFSFGRGLQRPTGIAFADGRLYVVDTGLHQVAVFSVDGGTELFRFGGRGSGAGLFNYPVDIAVSGGDRVYVNDSLNFRVQVFDGQGGLVSRLGGPGGATGQFQRSKGIALDSDGNLYVVDALADTVQVFDRQARFVLNFGRSGTGSGEFWLPAGIAIDGTDRVYVVDSYNRRVQTFQYLKGGTTDESR